MVVPNICGIAVYSPQMDSHMNSVKGRDFLIKVTQELGYRSQDVIYGLRKVVTSEKNHLHLLYQAAAGNIKELKKSLA